MDTHSRPTQAADPQFPVASNREWAPVPRQARADGWTPEKQRAFIETLADTGSVDQAARMVRMSVTGCYRLRRAPGAEDFNAAWSAAIDAASKKLLDAAFERALVGSEEPVFDREGNRVGRRFRQSDRMLMFLLRAYMPERFRHATHHTIRSGEPPAPPLAPVAEALALLGPELPEAPEPPAPPDPMPLGEEFERLLAEAKREADFGPQADDEEDGDEDEGEGEDEDEGDEEDWGE